MQKRKSLRSKTLPNLGGDKSNKCVESSTSGQRILIVPNNILNEEHDVELLKLRDPKNGNGLCCLMDKDAQTFYQLTNFQNEPSSMFVDDKVVEDGNLTFVTEVEPLFLILPYLKQINKFQPLDQILVDEKFPDCALLNIDSIKERMDFIANSKDFEKLKVYCFDWNKCKLWLKAKMNALVLELQNQKINVNNNGAQLATFIRKNDQAFSTDDYLLFAYGMISEYLPKDIAIKLFEYLGLKLGDEEDMNKEEDDLKILPPLKKQKLDSSAKEPTEDYFVERSSMKSNSEKTKLTACQRALSKVDKKGMKSISSFFKKV